MEQSQPLLNEFELAGQTIEHDENFQEVYMEKTTPKPRPTLSPYGRVCWGLLLSLCIWFLPRYRIRQIREKKLHATSYLDALRGIAAFCVVNHHTFLYKDTWIMQQPIIRIFWAGTGMVDVFFVISGYVLSYRMIKMIRTGQMSQLLESLASANFRRYLRLYGSATFASFIGLLQIRFQLHHLGKPQMPFLPALGLWFRDSLDFGNPFAHLTGAFEKRVTFMNPYLGPLWTIPVEFRGSMVIFTFCVMSCKLSTRGRMSLCWILVICSYYWSAIYGALFLLGLFLADVSFSRHPERLETAVRLAPGPNSPLPQHASYDRSRKCATIKAVVSVSACVIGLVLLGLPLVHISYPAKEGSWPYPFLAAHIPSRYENTGIAAHWWISIGSVLLVWGLDSFLPLQIPLTWSFPQYLGDLSFGIYVMHEPVRGVLMQGLISQLRVKYLGNSALAMLPEQIFYYFAVLWAADMFTRVDTKVVNFGRWLQLKTFRKVEA